MFQWRAFRIAFEVDAASHHICACVRAALVGSVALLLSACGGGGGNAPSYKIGGSISGLSGTVVIENNGTDQLSLASNGRFTFNAAISDGGVYNITIATQPPEQTCTVTNGSGTVRGKDITDVAVQCVANTYTVGGSISGLTGTVVITNNGADRLSRTANGSFTFATALMHGSMYSVSVADQPTGQICTVSNGTGTVSGADLTEVTVSCKTLALSDAEARSGAVTLTWSEVGADSYNIYYSKISGCNTSGYAGCPGGTAVSKVTSPYLVTGLSNGQSYWFKIEAVSGGGTALSNELGARPDQLTPDGPVKAIALGTDGTTYLGGTFQTVGMRIGHGVPISTATAHARAFPLVNGTVKAVADDGNGGWFIGGSFTIAGGAVRNNLAHIFSSGDLDPAWNPNADDQVDAIAVSGGTVYVGGAFLTIGGQFHSYLAAIDATMGTVAAWDPQANNKVLTLVVSGDALYAGGSFTSIGGQPRNYLAALDAGLATATAWDPNADASVNIIALSGNTLYAGGNFVTIGGQVRKYLAAIDITTGIVADWNPNPDQQINGLAVSGNTIYAGGLFTSIGGQPRRLLGAVDVATGSATAWDPNPDGVIYALEVSGDTVYAAGRFTSIGGQSRNSLAALDAATGTATVWDPDVDGGSVYAIAISGSTIYAGGDFFIIGGQPRNNVAALDVNGDLSAWNPSATRDYGQPVGVYALAISGNTVYVGGLFDYVDGQSRGNLAAVDAVTGKPSAWNPIAYAGGVGVLVVSGGTLYVGGGFSDVSGQYRSYLAAFDMASGVLTSWDPSAFFMSGFTGSVRALAVANNVVYAGGSFLTIGGQARNHLAAIDASTGTAKAWDPNPGGNGYMYALTLAGSKIYAGGWFTSIAGQSRNYLAELDIASGAATSWNPDADSYVNAIAMSGNTVYVGGVFSMIGGQMRRYLAAVDATTGMATAWQPDVEGPIYALVVSGNTVYAGGTAGLWCLSGE